MWACAKCSESIEDSFDACWKCGIRRDGSAPDPADAAEVVSDRAVDCCRCRCRLLYVGTKKFHEGTNWGLLGEIGELFVNRENFELYRCPRCGKVEFFIRGGEEGTA
jgi:hypothetical protein